MICRSGWFLRPSAGVQPSFFEWVGAGRYAAGSEQGAMYRSDRLIQQIYFGNDEENFYLRCDFRKWDKISLIVRFHQPADYVSVGDGHSDPRWGNQEYLLREPDGRTVAGDSLAAEDILELAVPLASLGLAGEGQIAFQVKVLKDGIERECHPETAPIQFALLGADFALRNWMV